MTPSHVDGLRATFAEAHRRSSCRIRARLKLTGHLWQGRFSSTALEDQTERSLAPAKRGPKPKLGPRDLFHTVSP